jgi:hypothetical protein
VDSEDELAGDFEPLAGEAKTESCMVFFALEHFGQVIAVFWFITMRS